MNSNKESNIVVDTKISVIIAVRNEPRLLREAVNSVLSQTFSEWECIIVDDGSTDSTLEVAKSFLDVRIRSFGKRFQGVSCARNFGFSFARTDFVLFLDADDVLHPAALGRLFHSLNSCALDIVAVFGRFDKVHADGTRYPGKRPLANWPEGAAPILDILLQENIMANGGHMLIRSSAVKAAGGFRPTVQISEDWVLWCHLAAIGRFQFIGGNEPILYLRMPQGKSTSALSSEWRHHIPAIRAVIACQDIRTQFTASAWKKLRCAIFASHMWEAGRVAYTLDRRIEGLTLMCRSLKWHFLRRRFLGLIVISFTFSIGGWILPRFRPRRWDARYELDRTVRVATHNQWR